MRNFNFKKLRFNQKGITLIALVITIIVLLILAGVSIATLTGENGILTRANDASKQTEIASVKEQAQLDISNWVAEELENGRDATIGDWKDIENILNTANPDAENRYYKNVTEEGVEAPNGYIVPIEEFYTTGTTGGVTEVTVANYGDRVNYISKGDSSLIWRIFYDDENYVYLISSKEDGSNTVESCTLENYINDYTGSVNITDSFLQSLNSKWFEVLGSTPSANNNAKAMSYLMDQDIWDEYKDSAGNASYAIGGPTLELFMNSYNASAKLYSRPYEIEITNCSTVGYSENSAWYWFLTNYNNGIYNNGSNFWISSPSGDNKGNLLYLDKTYSDIGSHSLNYILGLRPIVIIPKDKFQYSIMH